MHLNIFLSKKISYTPHGVFGRGVAEVLATTRGSRWSWLWVQMGGSKQTPHKPHSFPPQFNGL